MSSAGGRALRKRPGDRWVTVGDQQARRRVPRGPAGREPGFPDVFPSATSHGTSEGRVCLRRPRGPAVRRTLPETLRDMMVSRRPTGRGGRGGAGEGRGIVTPLSNFGARVPGIRPLGVGEERAWFGRLRRLRAAGSRRTMVDPL